MPTSSKPVNIRTGTWVDLYAVTGIELGTKLIIQNIDKNDTLLSESLNQPDLNFDNIGSNILSPGEFISSSDAPIGLWAYAATSTKLQVEPFTTGFKPIITEEENNSKTGYGELSTESLSPVVQINGHNGILEDVTTIVESSATVSTVDNMYTCDSGTDVDSIATIITLRHLSNKSGQGSMCRIGSIFGQGVVGNQQLCGFLTDENALGFGFISENFGIIHASNGKGEMQELTLTSFAAGAEDATVTIGGTPFTVSLSGGGSLGIDAFEIAVSLQSKVVNFVFASNGATVIARARAPNPVGSFAYSSATSAGAWVQKVAGLAITVVFTSQLDWNIDTRISSNPNVNLDPTKGNEYQIQYQSGFSDITFSVKDKVTSEFVAVHRIRYLNSNTIPNLSDPTMRCGWLSRNIGGTTSVRIQGDSAGLFTEGKRVLDTPPRALFNEQLVVSKDDDESILIIRNRQTFNNKVNRTDLFPLKLNTSTQANKFALFKLILNPVFSGPVIFKYLDEANSTIEFSNDKVIVTGGKVIDARVVQNGSPDSEKFNEGREDLVLLFGDVLAIVAIAKAAAADCQATIVLQEGL